MRFIARTAASVLLGVCACVASATTMCVTSGVTNYGKSQVQANFNYLDQQTRTAAANALATDYSGGNVCSWPPGEIQATYCKKYWEGSLPAGQIYTSLYTQMVLNEVPTPDLGVYWSEQRGIHGYTVRAQKWWEIYIYDTWAPPGNGVRGRIDGGVNPSMPGEMIGACWDTKSYIAYLNGVFTTATGVLSGLDAIRSKFGSRYRETPLEYQVLHNQTACNGQTATSCLADLAEVFAQRQTLLNASLAGRWEVFWEILAGRDSTSGSSTKGLKDGLGSLFVGFVSDLSESLRNQALKSMTAIFSKPTTDADGETFLSQLISNAEDNRSATVVVAHSQGNLFTQATKAKYEAYMARKWPGNSPPVSFVHVAPPTKSLVGPYVLSTMDLVIRGLGILSDGSVPDTNISVPFSTDDVTGHKFVETYFDSSRPAFEVVRKMIADSITSH